MSLMLVTWCHLPYAITQCYLSPETSECAPPNLSHARWYSIYLPQRDGRLSWASWLDSAPAGSRTSDLLITSPTPNCCTTKTTNINSNWQMLYLWRPTFLRTSHIQTHVLKPLLSTTRHSYNLRDRSHNYSLINKDPNINDCHFIVRLLYKHAY